MHYCVLLSLAPAFLFVTSITYSQQKAAPAHCEAVEGALLVREGADNWRALAAKDPAPADRLLVALFQAELLSANKKVGIKMLGDVGERGAFPVLESALVLHANPARDTEITLKRGAMVLSNRSKDAVKVRLHVLHETFDITLPDAKTQLAAEFYGRHVPGPPEVADAKKDVPVINFFLFALAGEPIIEQQQKVVRLHAPPGTALLHWDNQTESFETRFFDKLPELAKPLTPEEAKRFQARCALAHRLTAKPGPLGKTLDEMLPGAKDADGRKVAVTAMGAVDDLPRLVQALSQEKYADTRDYAVLVLRDWLGREAGQSVKLYDYLTKDRAYTAVQAKSLLYLLNGIERDKLRQPFTYELLLAGLEHSKLPVRELARWHLVRIVPDGKTIGYDAAAPLPQRQKAVAAWRRLIPEGELPRPPKQN